MKDMTLLHVLARPAMYVGSGPEATNSLVWFINGYMAQKYGLMIGGFGFQFPNPVLTLEENAKHLLEIIEAYELERDKK